MNIENERHFLQENDREFNLTKKNLLDPRFIAKRYDPDGRRRAFSEALEAREELHLTRSEISKGGEDLRGTLAEVNRLKELRQEKLTNLGERLEKKIAQLKGVLGVDDKTAQIIRRELEGVEADLQALLAKVRKTDEGLGVLGQKEKNLPSPRELLGAYYEKMGTLPMTQEEKREYLTPEFLESLSTEEYITLWKRLNPYFLAHVTRQGFRDHNAMIYHSGGLQEFHDGFTGIMEGGAILRPPLVLQGLRSRDRISVRRFLENQQVLNADNKEDALQKLEEVLHHSLASAPKYPDKTAIHFTAQMVGDAYYGGERGNEVFFVYPSDCLSSQYNFAFNGWQRDFTKPQSEDKWNDVFIWPNEPEDSGISVHAGIVFLPKETPVDAETGSKYASEVVVVDGEERRVLVEDKNFVQAFVSKMREPVQESILAKAFVDYKQSGTYSEREARGKIFLEVFDKELQELGLDKHTANHLSFSFFNRYAWAEGLDDEVITEKGLLELLKEAGAFWKRSEGAISAKEYWERYFSAHPELRPKHVIYYDGNPTGAIHEFQREHNIGMADVSKDLGPLLGFEDRHVEDMEGDPRANRGLEDLEKNAREIIEEYYGEQLKS